MSAAAGATVAGRVGTWRFGDDPAELVAALDRGAVLAIPTESSYGLAVDPLSERGVAAVLALKGSREGKGLPVVGGEVGAFVALGVDARDPAFAWVTARWPAALTVVVPLARPIPASMGRLDLALRIPGHERLRALLEVLGRPLTATSANPSGAAPYLHAGELTNWLARELSKDRAAAGVEAIVIDDGELPGGPPSTLVELKDGRPFVLRPGRVEI